MVPVRRDADGCLARAGNDQPAGAPAGYRHHPEYHPRSSSACWRWCWFCLHRSHLQLPATTLRVPLSSQYKDILTRSGVIVLLTILLNTYGTLTLVGGAIYSAYIFWRKKVLFNRMVGNILIAVGALMPAIGGSFIGMGLPDFLYLSEFLGAILMYIGFLQATATVPVKSTSPVTTAQ